jgi:hypothetical protein
MEVRTDAQSLKRAIITYNNNKKPQNKNKNKTTNNSIKILNGYL